jgi:hypothetical protein
VGEVEALAEVLRRHRMGFRDRKDPWYCAGCSWVAVVVADGRDADGVTVEGQHRAHLVDALAARDAEVRAEALREAADASRQPSVARWLRARADREGQDREGSAG